MKKALFVLGFAMCATFAYAQAPAKVTNAELLRARDVKFTEPTNAAPVDYKASIFTKDALHDSLRVFRFNAADMAQIQTGFIGPNDQIFIDGHDSTFGSYSHTVDVDVYGWAQWLHFDNIAACVAAFGTNQVYDGLNGYFPKARIQTYFAPSYTPGDTGIVDDGLMMFGFNYFLNDAGVGNINAYFTLPPVNHPNSGMVMIYLTQAHRKFADQCYIEYFLNNKWYPTEINVTGVDAEVNQYTAVHVAYTLPFALANVQQLNLRVRVSAQKYAAYGYGWALDNLAVVNNNNTESWSFNTPSTLDGFYGTLPQGMTIPVGYGVNVRNTNVTDLTNTTITLKNAPNGGAWTSVASSTPQTITAGNTEQNFALYINERGFVDETLDVDDHSQSWLGYYDNYGATQLEGGYLGRGLNTATRGLNNYTIAAQGGSLSRGFDTVAYTVSGMLEFDTNIVKGRVDGYRWARDNGVIPSNSAFAVSFTETGYVDNDDIDVDADGHSNMQGYYLTVRYVTGSEIPTEGGQPWVFRGMELVPCTARDTADMVTAEGTYIFQPLIWEEYYYDQDGDNYRRNLEVACGIDNMVYGVSHSQVSDLPMRGYKLPPVGSDANYSAIDIEFPDQPTLKPNTAYRFGYYLTEDALFNVAATSFGFLREDVDSTRSYARDAATAPYYNQNVPYQAYEIMVVDANGASRNNPNNHTIYGINCDSWPMIRPIVGPYNNNIPTVSLVGDCETNQGELGVEMERADEDFCGVSARVAVGSNQTIYITPKGGNSVIDEIKINGEVIPVYRSDEQEYPESYFLLRVDPRRGADYNVYDADSNIILAREGYELRLYGLPESATGSYVITATFHYEEQSIDDPIAANVALKLAPNPATSSVKLNIQGVSGMVNCSIIDMSGRVVYNAKVNADAETVLNVSSMPAGAYFVRVTNDDFSKVEKLIIK